MLFIIAAMPELADTSLSNGTEMDSTHERYFA
jgi:hypothetical protein